MTAHRYQLSAEDRIAIAETQLDNLERERRQRSADEIRSLETERFQAEVRLAGGDASAQTDIDNVDERLEQAQARVDQQGEDEAGIAKLLDKLRREAKS